MHTKIVVDLENCYGIKKLTYSFDFTKSRAYSIYAPNGFMKTSFSKTFSDFSKDQESKDTIFPDRLSKREITGENSASLNRENVFVVEPYNQDYNSQKTSFLLVNQSIKEQYDNALLNIEQKKEFLFKKLREISGYNARFNVENELLKVFNSDSIFDLLEIIEEEIKNAADDRLKLLDRLSSLKCAELFNEKTIAFLNSGQINSELSDYIKRYNELVDKSPILSKSFNHYHVTTIHKSLEDNGFFSANHSINLFDGTNQEEIKITSAIELQEKIETEKKRILSDEGLVEKFQSIDAKIKNAELRNFRGYLFENQDIITKLLDYQEFQKDIWKAYLKNQETLLADLLGQYITEKAVIQEAITTAKEENTQWKEVVTLFNNRFTVPFTLEVVNQEDVILKDESPKIQFTFEDQQKSSKLEKSELLKVLSQGEKRAFYILNILFELEVRKKSGEITLLLVDDIADSFDYKNKYAIIEYLSDISDSQKFHSIFLTHNFDFHRTVSGRLGILRENRLFAVKDGNNLSLIQEKYQKNPFEHWRKNLHCEARFVISSIPFIRNLAEYCGWNSEYDKLTSLLHFKSDTLNIKMQELNTIYQTILQDQQGLSLEPSDKVVIERVYEISDEIISESNEQAELESKIVLSIAIRLKAEQFMIAKIADDSFVNSITSNQTIKLLKHFKAKFPSEIETINVLEQVNLMTPENIHINSFMYEPILDMSPQHLKDLYTKIKEI